MPTNTQGTNARKYVQHQVHYRSVDFTFANDGQTLSMGYLPAGATVVGCGVVVSTLFNGNSSNILDIGPTADPDGLAADLALGTVGVIRNSTLATSNDAGPYAADTEIFAFVTATASASTGVGRAFVEYILDEN